MTGFGFSDLGLAIGGLAAGESPERATVATVPVRRITAAVVARANLSLSQVMVFMVVGTRVVRVAEMVVPGTAKMLTEPASPRRARPGQS